MFVLHGGFLDNRHMVDAMEPLFEHRSGWKRIYIDLPGHGKSTVNTSVTSHDQVLDIILNFVKVIAPEQSFAVVGESRGGYLARGIVHQVPDSVDGLLLIVPGRYAACSKDPVPPHVTLVAADELVPTLAQRKGDALIFRSGFRIHLLTDTYPHPTYEGKILLILLDQ
jgi:pimeloyl-ACP methyl ester carboxylesterase